MTRSIQGEFGRFADRHNFRRQLQATAIVATANTLAAGRYHATIFRSGQLVITVPTQAERYLIQPELSEIQAKLNEQLGDTIVKRIAVRLQLPDQRP